MLSLFVLFFCIHAFVDLVLISKINYDEQWIQYKEKYNLEYTQEEDARRFAIYVENMEFIMHKNAENSDLVLAPNSMTHLESHEVPKCLRYKANGKLQDASPTLDSQTLPIRPEIDYREFGVVAPIKDQKNCGSCYAFGAIGSLESHLAIRAGQLVTLSEQEIVDCSQKYGNNGCDGGLPEFVYEYIKEHGISKDHEYPYYANDSKCLSRPKRLYPVGGFVRLRSGDEHQLVRALSFVGPLSIGIDADHKEFRFYKSGVLSIPSCESESLDHAVIAVGYSTVAPEYVLIKNSWGVEWGDEGYVKMALYKGNMCGMASDATYPLISGYREL